MRHPGKFIVSDTLTFSELMRENFIIPHLQRTYQWTNKEFGDLWKDLDEYRKLNGLDNDYEFQNEKFIDKPLYPLGAIYVTPATSQKFELLDGQQRITTLSIALLVLKDIFVSLSNDSKFKKTLASFDNKLKETKRLRPLHIINYINSAIRTDTLNPRISYENDNVNSFWEEICSADDSVQLQEALDRAAKGFSTQTNIVYSFEWHRTYFRKRLSKLTNIKINWKPNERVWTFKNPKDLTGENEEDTVQFLLRHLLKYITTILHCIVFVKFECESQQITLFDTINNRGKAFDVADLSRLALMTECRDNVQLRKDLLDIWSSIHVTEDLLNNTWNAFFSRHPESQEIKTEIASKKLHAQLQGRLDYIKLKSSNKQPNNIEENKTDVEYWLRKFVTKLQFSFNVITSIKEAGNSFNFNHPDIKKLIFFNEFNFIRFTTPIIFSIEFNISDNRFKKQLYSYFLNFITRFAICRDPNSKRNKLPLLAAQLCELIASYKEEHNTLKDKIDSYIQKSEIFLEVSDDNFKKCFANYSLTKKSDKSNPPEYSYDQSLARFGYFIVATIENHLAGKNQTRSLTEYGPPNKDQSSNDLEHIYPRHANKNDWPDAPIDEQTVNLIGNLLPLNSIQNSSVKNFTLDVKIQKYQEQNLNLVRDFLELAKNPDGTYSWTAEKIRTRSEQLAAHCCEYFPLKFI